MAISISSLGVQLLSNSNLLNQQTNLNQLNEQLGSGQQYDDLTDYAPIDAHNLMNFQNAVTQKQAYISSMQTASTRLSVYDSTMTDMENIATQAGELASQNSNLNTAQVGALQQQAQAYLEGAVTDLNQQVNGRYIYAGTRYTTQPVIDASAILALPTPSTGFTTGVSGPNLPNYDSEYNNPPGTTSDAQAWAQDSVTIDAGDSMQYGVTSTQTGFQQLVAGLQLISAATQPGVDATTYQQDMSAASGILGNALTNIQTYHAGVADATNTLTQETTQQNTDITNLQDQIGNIQNVNLTQVGTELNQLQTQLQASYSATSTLLQNTILKYLS